MSLVQSSSVMIESTIFINCSADGVSLVCYWRVVVLEVSTAYDNYYVLCASCHRMAGA